MKEDLADHTVKKADNNDGVENSASDASPRGKRMMEEAVDLSDVESVVDGSVFGEMPC